MSSGANSFGSTSTIQLPELSRMIAYDAVGTVGRLLHERHALGDEFLVRRSAVVHA
jgi:hypothetical protein